MNRSSAPAGNVCDGRPRLVVIGGPTASGKSVLALHLAEALGAFLVNADSMQMYRDLRVLTARPTAADEARVPHRLFGVLDASQIGSVGDWLTRVADVLSEARTADRPLVVVGGTGLYLRALLHGLAPVPTIPAPTRANVRALFDRSGAAALRAELKRTDPEMAERLRANDPQRQMRALEVMRATGRSLASWQEERLHLELPEPRVGLALLVDRAALHRRIERRLGAMLDAGALDELRALRSRNLDHDLPLMKAVAVPELMGFIEGRSRLEEAVRRATAATRRFAKRQITWLRHQLPELEPIPAFGEDVVAGRVEHPPHSGLFGTTTSRRHGAVDRAGCSP